MTPACDLDRPWVLPGRQQKHPRCGVLRDLEDPATRARLRDIGPYLDLHRRSLVVPAEVMHAFRRGCSGAAGLKCRQGFVHRLQGSPRSERLASQCPDIADEPPDRVPARSIVDAANVAVAVHEEELLGVQEGVGGRSVRRPSHVLVGEVRVLAEIVDGFPAPGKEVPSGRHDPHSFRVVPKRRHIVHFGRHRVRDQPRRRRIRPIRTGDGPCSPSSSDRSRDTR